MVIATFLAEPLVSVGGSTSMATIAEQLQTYREALAAAQARGDEATKKKIEQNIKDLEEYSKRHPEASESPSPLEVFCDLHPSDINCLVYDD